MKPRITIDTATTPDGSLMELVQHGDDFTIKIAGQDLMLSRQNESELELARLGCSHLCNHPAPKVLIGGMGMGYTLRETLSMLDNNASIVVAELLDSVITWNREFLSGLNNNALADPRVTIETGDIVNLLQISEDKYDAILLDIDNGPGALTDEGNRRLYGYEGMQTCRSSLRDKGILAVWSAEPSKKFEQLLVDCNFHVRRFRVAAYKGSKSKTRFVWVASEDESILPSGGGEPRMPKKKPAPPFRRRQRQTR